MSKLQGVVVLWESRRVCNSSRGVVSGLCNTAKPEAMKGFRYKRCGVVNVSVKFFRGTEKAAKVGKCFVGLLPTDLLGWGCH